MTRAGEDIQRLSKCAIEVPNLGWNVLIVECPHFGPVYDYNGTNMLRSEDHGLSGDQKVIGFVTGVFTTGFNNDTTYRMIRVLFSFGIRCFYDNKGEFSKGVYRDFQFLRLVK